MKKKFFENKLTYLAILAAILGIISDILLLYNPEGNYGAAGYVFLKNLPTNRMLWGHYLGILSIPFLILGSFKVNSLIQYVPVWYKYGLMIVSFLLLVLGVAYHALLVPIHLYIQNQEINNYFLYAVKPLEMIVATLFILFCILCLVVSLHKKASFNRNIKYFNPIFWAALSYLLYFICPIVGNFTAVAALNLPVAIFLIGTIICDNKEHIDL